MDVMGTWSPGDMCTFQANARALIAVLLAMYARSWHDTVQ